MSRAPGSYRADVVAALCIVAASLTIMLPFVREGQVVGPYRMVAGTPAKVKRELDEESIKPFLQPAKNYLRHSAGHREIEIKIP